MVSKIEIKLSHEQDDLDGVHLYGSIGQMLMNNEIPFKFSQETVGESLVTTFKVEDTDTQYLTI